MGRLSLYWNTVRYMKPSQVYYRLRKIAGLNCSLGGAVKPYSYGESLCPIPAVGELDFDSVFLRRFPTEELLRDHVTLLYEGEDVSWNENWDFPDHSPLWNFNLHYFEYLFPLTKEYLENGDRACLNKIKECILGWIHSNPRSKGGNAWAAYTISLRLTNWLSVYTWLQKEIEEDTNFCRCFLQSIHEQYAYLSQHLEKDLLGNHYFEDLKTLVLCALFFEDEEILDRAGKLLLKQCKEQILPDGMHFELSPMYHKIILEDVIRVAAALRGCGKPSSELESYLAPMVDAAFSLEDGLDRLPLFNDCGSNISKSLDALCQAAKRIFGIQPVRKMQLPDAGYYIFEQGDIRLIVDAGKPGPEYLPGHAHCDALSFELFYRGKPTIVNCGTFAYQSELRSFFKATRAHNTAMLDETEQSQCWGAFRMGKRSNVVVKDVSEHSLHAILKDQCGNQIIRYMEIKDNRLRIEDKADGHVIHSFLHFAPDDRPECIENHVLRCHYISVELDAADHAVDFEYPYAEEYGLLDRCTCVKIQQSDSLKIQIAF